MTFEKPPTRKLRPVPQHEKTAMRTWKSLAFTNSIIMARERSNSPSSALVVGLSSPTCL